MGSIPRPRPRTTKAALTAGGSSRQQERKQPHLQKSAHPPGRAVWRVRGGQAPRVRPEGGGVRGEGRGGQLRGARRGQAHASCWRPPPRGLAEHRAETSWGEGRPRPCRPLESSSPSPTPRIHPEALQQVTTPSPSRLNKTPCVFGTGFPTRSLHHPALIRPGQSGSRLAPSPPDWRAAGERPLQASTRDRTTRPQPSHPDGRLQALQTSFQGWARFLPRFPSTGFLGSFTGSSYNKPRR